MLRNQILIEWENLKKKIKLLSEAQENQVELKEEIQEQDKLIDELKLEQKRLIEEHQKEINEIEKNEQELKEKISELEKTLNSIGDSDSDDNNKSEKPERIIETMLKGIMSLNLIFESTEVGPSLIDLYKTLQQVKIEAKKVMPGSWNS